MKTTLNIDDHLLTRAKAAAALGRTTLTQFVEEGLALRLRCAAGGNARRRPLPVFDGTGLAEGVNPLSNRSLRDAEEA